MTRAGRRILLLLAVVVAGVLLWTRLATIRQSGAPTFSSRDLIIYWSGARLVREGGNPYDPAALVAVERAAGLVDADPTVDLIWNPPWALTLVLPLAFLPLRMATGVWFVGQFGILLTCGVLLWRYYAPGDKRAWVGLVMAAGFVPGLQGLREGQISIWLLVGVVVFLYAQRDGRDILAGAALALLTIKPHMTYLVWVAVVWWVFRSRRWRVFLGLLVALAGSTAVVAAFAPGILADYFVGVVAAPPLLRAPPTIGGWVRFVVMLACDTDLRWIQFIPTAVGVLSLLVWLFRQRKPWRWRSVAPLLLLASPPTAVYGWTYDQVAVLAAVAALISHLRFARPRPKAAVLVGLVATQIGAGAQIAASVPEFFRVWHPLALAGLYWLGTRPRWQLNPEEEPRTAEPMPAGMPDAAPEDLVT